MLDKLKYESCPCCKAKIHRMTKENQHCNGHWNETVEFECGCEMKWSPNFMREETSHICKRAHGILLNLLKGGAK